MNGNNTASVEGCEARDILSVGEAGLFYNLQAEKSFKGEAYRGVQKSKLHVTLLFYCCADRSEKMQLTVMGKSQKAQCYEVAGQL